VTRESETQFTEVVVELIRCLTFPPTDRFYNVSSKIKKEHTTGFTELPSVMSLSPIFNLADTHNSFLVF